MVNPIKPLGDRVVAVREEVQQKTASGLYLPGDVQEKPVVARVAAVGPKVATLKKGDRIFYKEYAATEVKVDGVDYLIIKEEDILAKVV